MSQINLKVLLNLNISVSRSNGVVPYPPELRVVTVNQSSITLSWEFHPTGGSSILHYRVYYR